VSWGMVVATYRIEEVDPGLYLLRVGDRMTRYFEALWEIPEGVTYNAYVLKTGEGAVLFDGWKSTFSGPFLEALEQVIEPGELRYVVAHHLEPDHSGTLEDVLRWAPHARVLGHPFAERMLTNYPRARERFRPVGDWEELVLGGERLQFIHAPWLHWPETMFTWLPERRVLLTCDAFGGFGVPEGVFDDECQRPGDIFYSIRKYHVTVIGHYRRWVHRAIEKLERHGVEPRIIAPAHGLLWRGDPGRVIQYYKDLSDAKPVPGKVTVLYASMYGTVESLARMVACELRKAGYNPVVYGFTDTQRPPVSSILADVVDSEALVVAAPTYEAGLFPLMRYVLEEICEKAPAPKKLAVLATYGWGGVAAKRIRGLLESCEYQTIAVLEEQAVTPYGGFALQERTRELARRIVGALQGSER